MSCSVRSTLSAANLGRLCQILAVCIVGLTSSAAVGFDPLAGDYTRGQPLDIRIVAYNHNRNFISDPGADAAFDRILTVLDADVYCFEEFPSSVSVADVENRMDSIIPIGGAGWQVHFGLMAGIRTVIASRYPLLQTRVDTIPTSSTRGVTIALVDLPDGSYPTDVYLLGVHLKCCGDPGGTEDAKRQNSADAIANWLGDARGVSRPSGDNIVLPSNTPMIALGDFNLVGGPQPELTIITGDIQDEGTYGPDVKGDWDNTDLTNLMPTDPFTGDTFTWQGNGTFPPSALDRMFYTDSVVTVANSFVLNTDTMTGPALAAAGLQASDTLPGTTSDHLPIVLDLSTGPALCSAVGAFSCRDHGLSGVLCLNLGPVGGVEPRFGGVTALDIDLVDASGFGGGVTVDCTPTAYTGTATHTGTVGNTVTITFGPGLPDETFCTIALDCGAEVCVRNLEGDSNLDGAADPVDNNQRLLRFGLTATAAGGEWDVNTDGDTNPVDNNQTLLRFGNSAPACP